MLATAPARALAARPRPAPFALASVYAVSLLCAGIGQNTAIIPDVAPMFWPPVGVLLAVLLVAPMRQWPWWIMASTAAELTANQIWWHNSLLLSLGYAAANVIEAVAGAVLMLRLAPRFSTLRWPVDTALFVVLCGAVTPTITATMIAAIDVWIGKAAFLETWIHIWLGNAAGVLVAAPLTLGVIDLWRIPRTAGYPAILEIASLGLLLGFVSVTAMLGYLPTIYLALPVLMWAAMRWQMHGALPCLAILILVSTAFSNDRAGRFANMATVDREIVDLQVFFAVAGISSLFTAVLSQQHKEAIKVLKRSNQILETRVNQRTARLASALRAGRLGVISFDRQHHRARLDSTTQTFFGTAQAALTITDLAQIVHAADRREFLEQLERALAGEDEGRLELRFRIGESSPRTFMLDMETPPPARAAALTGIVQDISERVEAQRRQRLLIDELSHRVKNTLSIVQAIAMQTLQGKAERNARDAFLSRIAAFARGHDLLAQEGWEAAALDDLVRQAVAPHGAERFELVGQGRSIFLPATQALAIAMGLHELCTNSAKHGALSLPEGRVRIGWALSADRQRFRILWIEQGGPPVLMPNRRGFGSVLLEKALAQDLKGTVVLSYEPGGVVCEIEGPMITEPAATVDLARESA